jgi:hypothetical protein
MKTVFGDAAIKFAPASSVRFGLASAASLSPQDKPPKLTNADPADATRRFHERINETAMTVGR